MVRDQTLEDSAVAYLAVGVQTSEGRCKQGWIWWQDFMRALGESPEQHGELADGPQVRLRIEGYYLRFVVWLVHVRRVQVETARKYFGVTSVTSGRRSVRTPRSTVLQCPGTICRVCARCLGAWRR